METVCLEIFLSRVVIFVYVFFWKTLTPGIVSLQDA